MDRAWQERLVSTPHGVTGAAGWGAEELLSRMLTHVQAPVLGYRPASHFTWAFPGAAQPCSQGGGWVPRVSVPGEPARPPVIRSTLRRSVLSTTGQCSPRFKRKKQRHHLSMRGVSGLHGKKSMQDGARGHGQFGKSPAASLWQGVWVSLNKCQFSVAGTHEITSRKDHVNVSMESGLEGLSKSNLGVTAIIQVDSSWQIYPPASKGFPGGCSLIDLITRLSFHSISKKEVFNKTRIQSDQAGGYNCPADATLMPRQCSG